MRELPAGLKAIETCYPEGISLIRPNIENTVEYSEEGQALSEVEFAHSTGRVKDGIYRKKVSPCATQGL